MYADSVNMGNIEEDETPDYPVTVFLSREGYFKKITPQSLRMSSEQKYKAEDGPHQQTEAMNRGEILFFTNRQQVYKTKISAFEDGKASVLGVYLPTVLGMDEGESVLYMVCPGDYSGHLLFFFENGKAARVELSAYATKTNRKRLSGAFSDKSPLTALIQLQPQEEREIVVYSSEGRALVFTTSMIQPKSTRTTVGVGVLNLKQKYKLTGACFLEDTPVKNVSRYRVHTLPAAGALLKEEDRGEVQLTIDA